MHHGGVTARTVGVDLSAEFKDTWMATIEWSDGKARLAGLDEAVSDEAIVEAAQGAGMLGIDCPFGWPEMFYQFVGQHRDGDVDAQHGPGKVWREQLAYRVTDLALKKLQPGSNILSVSTDKLGRVAFRCAALLAQMKAVSVDVDRSGMTGSIVEIYPAGSLRAWGHTSKGYKASNDVLAGMVEVLLRDAPWLELADDQRERCETTHDALDAVIASLTARAVALSRATAPQPDQMGFAKMEGWIRLPLADSLPRLADM